MSNLLIQFDLEIIGFNQNFQNKTEITAFINALNHLKSLAETDLQQSCLFSWARTKINWAPSLVERLTVILRETTTEDALGTNLPRLIALCQEYEKKADITYPWARALGILVCSAIGLLLGLPIGAVVGCIGIFICIGLSTGPAGPWSHDLSGTVGVILAVVGASIGAIGGVVLGASSGYILGSSLVDADFSDLSNAIFFQQEHLALNECAVEIQRCGQVLAN